MVFLLMVLNVFFTYFVKVVTFQVVLAYNVHRSFILFNYGDIATTTQSWTVCEVQVFI